MPDKIEFDGRKSARPVREDKTIKPFLHETDDKRTGTVILKDSTPERVVEKVVGEAAESREKNAEKFGNVALTNAERDKIDFTETDVPTARAAKAAAGGMGVSDWISHFDETLTASENREAMKRAARQGGGRRDEGRQTGSNAKRLAQANKRRKAEASGRLRDFAILEQDDAAQDELRSQTDSLGEFDIGFSRRDGRLEGSGEDFNRVSEVHQDRSERAQRVDERRSAKVTRDPIQWANNPGQFDFPGVDTVQPNELHEQRSEKAQRVDERNIAPTADSRQQWAQNPDQYDYPGVDRPQTYGPTANRSVPSPERNTDAPEPFTSRLSNQDVSLSPEEAFEGVGVGSLSESAESDPDPGFMQAEEQRSSAGGLLDTPDSAQAGFGGETDDNQQSAFDLEDDIRESQGQESRRDVAEASEFGIDDREVDNSEPDSGEQEGLEVFGGGTRENQTLF
jgi:hypothetical protein